MSLMGSWSRYSKSIEQDGRQAEREISSNNKDQSGQQVERELPPGKMHSVELISDKYYEVINTTRLLC